MKNKTDLTVECVIRSLVSADEFSQYERSGKYNLGDGFLNKMIADLTTFGQLNPEQHTKLKKRLASCQLNVHLDERPDAKRYGSFVRIKGDL